MAVVKENLDSDYYGHRIMFTDNNMKYYDGILVNVSETEFHFEDVRERTPVGPRCTFYKNEIIAIGHTANLERPELNGKNRFKLRQQQSMITEEQRRELNEFIDVGDLKLDRPLTLAEEFHPDPEPYEPKLPSALENVFYVNLENPFDENRNCFDQALQSVEPGSIVGLAAFGENVSRFGDICFISLAIIDYGCFVLPWTFDAQNKLKHLLESEDIRKVMYNGAGLADALWNRYDPKIQLVAVSSLAGYDCVLSKQQQTKKWKLPEKFRSLTQLIEDYTELDLQPHYFPRRYEQVDEFKCINEKMSQAAENFVRRECGLLPILYDAMISALYQNFIDSDEAMLSSFKAASNAEVRQIRKCLEDQLASSKYKRFATLDRSEQFNLSEALRNLSVDKTFLLERILQTDPCILPEEGQIVAAAESSGYSDGCSTLTESIDEALSLTKPKCTSSPQPKLEELLATKALTISKREVSDFKQEYAQLTTGGHEHTQPVSHMAQTCPKKMEGKRKPNSSLSLTQTLKNNKWRISSCLSNN